MVLFQDCRGSRGYYLKLGISVMKVRCKKKSRSGAVAEGEIYEVLSIEGGWYRIIDASDEDYLYPPEMFEIVEKEPIPPPEIEPENEQDDDFFLWDDEPDPLSMSEEEYSKAREAYIQKVRKESEKMRRNKEKFKGGKWIPDLLNQTD
jgi:hypothetical protein